MSCASGERGGDGRGRHEGKAAGSGALGRVRAGTGSALKIGCRDCLKVSWKLGAWGRARRELRKVKGRGERRAEQAHREGKAAS